MNYALAVGWALLSLFPYRLIPDALSCFVKPKSSKPRQKLFTVQTIFSAPSYPIPHLPVSPSSYDSLEFLIGVAIAGNFAAYGRAALAARVIILSSIQSVMTTELPSSTDIFCVIKSFG